MANPLPSWLSSFGTWDNFNKWLFSIIGWLLVIAGWFAGYLFNGSIQRKTKKQNIQIESAFEVLEKSRALSEILHELVCQINLIHERIPVMKKKKTLEQIIADMSSLNSLQNDVNEAISHYHNYSGSRIYILFECNKKILDIEDVALNILQLTKEYLLELFEIYDDLGNVYYDILEMKLDTLDNIDKQITQLIENDFYNATEELNEALHNVYLSKQFGFKRIKPTNPIKHSFSAMVSKITNRFKA